MAEEDAVRAAAAGPATVESLATELTALGVSPGSTLLVHSSLSSLGWVCGGAVSVVLALEKALGPEGTLVMPTQSGDVSEPRDWHNPPVPEPWWETIRSTMPAFDVDMTPTRGVGVVPECFRKQRGTLRSDHPSASFAARGANAEDVVSNHRLEYSLGEQSPLARLYDLDAEVLMLGTGYGCLTSLHLAEYRADYPGKRSIMRGAPIMVDGERRWMEFEDIDWTDSDFAVIGREFSAGPGHVVRGKVGCADAQLMSHRALVDFAVGWMTSHRSH